jgi:hypothetical protein
MIGPGDLLLRWLSETGSGKLRDLLDAAEWVASNHRLKLRWGAPGRWIRDASALGYLDIDWPHGRWAAAPAVLTRLPDSDGYLLLTGSRTVTNEERLAAEREEWIEAQTVGNPCHEGDIPCPQTVLIQSDSGTDLPSLARRLGAKWVSCAALQLAQMLPDVAVRGDAASPLPGEPLERFDLELRRFVSVGRLAGDGLYRFRRADHQRPCQLLRGRDWYLTSYEEGVYLELARSEQTPGANIRWLRDKGRGRDHLGALIVDWGSPLPSLQARTAALCSGLTPRFFDLATTARYENVPLKIAESIAASLKQQLGIAGT